MQKAERWGALDGAKAFARTAVPDSKKGGRHQGGVEKKLRHEASKDQHTLAPETERYAPFVMVATTFPAKDFPTEAVLEYYRFRWQVERLFKRCKQHAHLGHLPK